MARLGPSMKRVVILVALVLILAGAGGAGWWFFLREAPAEESAAAEPAAADPSGTSRTVALEPIVLPILREGRVIQHLTLLLQVDLAGPEPDTRISYLRPRLRDSILKALHGVLAFRHVNKGEGILPVVRERLKKAGNDVFGPGRVDAVLVLGMSRRVPDEG